MEKGIHPNSIKINLVENPFMPLDISWRYLLKKNKGICQQYRQRMRMSRTQWGEKSRPSRCGNSTDQIRILYKMKSIRIENIIRTNLN